MCAFVCVCLLTRTRFLRIGEGEESKRCVCLHVRVNEYVTSCVRSTLSSISSLPPRVSVCLSARQWMKRRFEFSQRAGAYDPVMSRKSLNRNGYIMIF